MTDTTHCLVLSLLLLALLSGSSAGLADNTAGCTQAPSGSLIAQYEPVIKLTANESYHPQDIDSYLAQCELKVDQILGNPTKIPQGQVTASSLAQHNQTNAYVQFADDTNRVAPGPNINSVNTAAAAMTGKKRAYYARELDQGGYKVLQYWFFYPMNDWREHGGFNNHEGDWEMVTVFLRPKGEGNWEPAHAAYSAHHEGGDFVRHDWSTLQTEGTHPVVYVGSGSHANYPQPGLHQGEDWSTQDLAGYNDSAVGDGAQIGGTSGQAWEQRNVFDENNLPSWVTWQGQWGLTSNMPGFAGPSGPMGREKGAMWNDPAGWANVPPLLPALSIVFLVDCSGSMGGDKIAGARAAVKSSVAQTNDGRTEWAVLGFGACSCWEECGFTQLPGVAAAADDGLSTGGDTPLTYSMYVALRYLTDNGRGQTGRLIILCDGQDNCPERGSTTQEKAMAGLKTIVRGVQMPQNTGGNP